MTLRAELRLLRRRWRVIVGCVILGLGAAVVLTFASGSTYRASEQLFVSTPVSDANISNAYSGSEFSQQRVKSYAEIAGSPAVTEPVIGQLHLPFTPAQLANRISATAPLDTVLLNISVTDSNPHRAAAIANAVGDQLVRLVSQLEKPTTGAASPLRVTVVKPAAVPTSPVSPNKQLNLELGFLLGLALGVGGARVRERLDTTVKSADEIVELVGAPTLGIIGFDADVPDHPLVVKSHPTSRAAEGFRQLRTNLQFVNVDKRPKSIVISSAASGEGKSTTAANLALAMSESGSRVLLLDADLRKPRVADYLGLDGTLGLTTILAQGSPPRSVMQQWGTAGMWVLPSGVIPPNPSELLGSAAMARLLIQLAVEFDAIIIDAPPLLPVTDAVILAAIADGVLLVVQHGQSKRDEVGRAAAELANVDCRVFGSILNMEPTKRGVGYYYEASPASKSRHGDRKSNAAAPSAEPTPRVTLVTADAGTTTSAVSPSSPSPSSPSPSSPSPSSPSPFNPLGAEPARQEPPRPTP